MNEKIEAVNEYLAKWFHKWKEWHGSPATKELLSELEGDGQQICQLFEIPLGENEELCVWEKESELSENTYNDIEDLQDKYYYGSPDCGGEELSKLLKEAGFQIGQGRAKERASLPRQGFRLKV